jgi:hypothetical protein
VGTSSFGVPPFANGPGHARTTWATVHGDARTSDYFPVRLSKKMREAWRALDGSGSWTAPSVAVDGTLFVAPARAWQKAPAPAARASHPFGDGYTGETRPEDDAMIDRRSIESRLIRTLGAIAVIAILGVLAILPYRLYDRDIRHAKVQAHRLSSVVQTALAQAVVNGEDPTDLINRLQGLGDVDIQLARLDAGQLHPAAGSAKGRSELSGTLLTYTAPPILGRGGEVWLAEMEFDLAPMKRESVRLIIDLVLAVALGSLVFSLVVFLLVRQSVVVPLREFVRTIDRRHPNRPDVAAPEFETAEMRSLVDAVERACAAHEARP